MSNNEPTRTNAVSSRWPAELMAGVLAVGLSPRHCWWDSVSNAGAHAGRILGITAVAMWVGLIACVSLMLVGIVVLSRIRSTKQMLAAAKIYADREIARQRRQQPERSARGDRGW